jgi:hypothetical protein
MTNRALIDSTLTPSRRAKIRRAADCLLSYAVYGLITGIALTAVGLIARGLFFGLQLGWRIGSKLFGQ